MVDSIDFAKIIINRALSFNEDKGKKEKIILGETKLHKLLYICDGFLLAGNLNIIGENAKAWNYGPVYPRVNTWLKKDPDAFTKKHEDVSETEEIKEVSPLIDMVINSFGKWSANQLSNWSHGPGSPWEKALIRGKGVMNSVIDKGDIKKYFEGIIGANA